MNHLRKLFETYAARTLHRDAVLAEAACSYNPQELNSEVADELAFVETSVDCALGQSIEEALLLASTPNLQGEQQALANLILARAGTHPHSSGTGLLGRYAPSVLRSSSDVVFQFAYLRKAYPGLPLPNALRKAWASFLTAVRDVEQLASSKSYGGVGLLDVINKVHPAPSPALRALVTRSR
ncbi:hypothetical protein LC612_30605 [Nostoc sp. CHAB 5834]|nr:hypothetical protein [Nostoc sp. CHAB 5834]